MDRKKELKHMYKEMKPEMGVFQIICKPTGKVYLGIDQNIKGTLNSTLFQLQMGSFLANRNLQKDWNQHGESNFEISVLEILDYDKDQTKTDYMDDLRVLRDFWREKFENAEYIKK